MDQPENFYLLSDLVGSIFSEVRLYMYKSIHTRLKKAYMNRFNTMVLLATLTALFLLVGQALGGRGGLMIALVFAGVMSCVASWWSDKIVLRMYGAQEVSEAQAPELFALVRGLAQRARIPMP